ncbi:unnamed protein product [Symbiodinium natans]|uniref:CSD domain-containing protein n=1 Tax=Symbiodinium natans TaxID=878477 RepID=A0A812MC08_9DINO|nr:unnamed protein product [Symbiodinium natans]
MLGETVKFVVLFNEAKAYGLIKADTSESEAFFSTTGLAEGYGPVAVGDKVFYFEDDEMIEGQLCAVNIRKRLAK